MSFITGVGLTAFGRHEGSSTLDLMSKAAGLAIADAGLKRSEVDGVLCGYSTVAPHIMLATVFAEHFGIRPTYAHAVQVGGATTSAKHWARETATFKRLALNRNSMSRGRESAPDVAIETMTTGASCPWNLSTVPMRAPGGPGSAPGWGPGRKQAFGAAPGPRSRVWFTIARGNLSDVFYPAIDRPVPQGLRFLAPVVQFHAFPVNRLGLLFARIVRTRKLRRREAPNDEKRGDSARVHL